MAHKQLSAPMAVVLASTILTLGACQGDPGRVRPTASPVTTEPKPRTTPQKLAGKAESAVASDSVRIGPPLSEGGARRLLAERFRAAGFRILHDIRITTAGVDLTVDGYDPARKVGFEYVASEERNTDLTAAERIALRDQREHRLLVVDATSAAAVIAAARRFLQEIKPASSASDPP